MATARKTGQHDHRDSTLIRVGFRHGLRCLNREYGGVYVFTTERNGPLTTSTARNLIARTGEKAGFDFPVHPHMLRHSTGYYLANTSLTYKISIAVFQVGICIMIWPDTAKRAFEKYI